MKLLRHSQLGADVRITTEEACELLNALDGADWSYWSEARRAVIRTVAMFCDAIICGEYERVWDYGEDMC